MTHTLKALLYLDATADGGAFPITEMFYEPESWRLRYAALDIGGWSERREVLVSLDQFGTPREDGWPVSMSRQSIEDAPEWADAPQTPSALPPLIVGPFGSTFSPLMMAAQMRGLTRPERSESPESDLLKASLTDVSGRIYAMEPASAWIGREAFGPVGPLGAVEDVTVDPGLVMTNAVFADGSERALADLRHLAEQGHAVFD